MTGRRALAEQVAQFPVGGQILDGSPVVDGHVGVQFATVACGDVDDHGAVTELADEADQPFSHELALADDGHARRSRKSGDWVLTLAKDVLTIRLGPCGWTAAGAPGGVGTKLACLGTVLLGSPVDGGGCRLPHSCVTRRSTG